MHDTVHWNGSPRDLIGLQCCLTQPSGLGTDSAWLLLTCFPPVVPLSIYSNCCICSQQLSLLERWRHAAGCGSRTWHVEVSHGSGSTGRICFLCARLWRSRGVGVIWGPTGFVRISTFVMRNSPALVNATEQPVPHNPCWGLFFHLFHLGVCQLSACRHLFSCQKGWTGSVAWEQDLAGTCFLNPPQRSLILTLVPQWPTLSQAEFVQLLLCWQVLCS